MKKSYLILLAGLLLAGCSDGDGCKNNGPESSVWELSSADYLLLKGKVSQVVETSTDTSNPDDPYTMTLLDARFDASGRIVSYNPTGVDFSESAQSLSTRAGWEISSACEFAYDGLGRMNSVVSHTLGELTAITYQITYGDHQSYVPVPFVVMDKPLWLLRGVTAITGSDGYTLQCDGVTATADYPEGWSGKRQVSVFFEGEYPARSVSVTTLRGETTQTATTTYTWGANGRLMRTSVVTQIPEEEPSTEVVEYDARLLCSPVRKSFSSGGEVQAEIAYDYHGNGLPSAARYPVGSESEWFGQPFTMEYSDEDAQGNWLKCKKIIPGEDTLVTVIDRTITYR